MVIKSNVRKILAFVLAVWCSMALWSQDSSGWYYGKKIRAVNFEGLNHITKMDLAGVIDPFIGLEFTDEVYLDLLNRVYALEFFDDFTPVALPGDEKGNSVIIQFASWSYTTNNRTTILNPISTNHC